jgi:phospholipid/cholesterol/gamma-HCH transport system permease protein
MSAPAWTKPLADLGYACRSGIEMAGRFARFFLAILVNSRTAFVRLRLTIKEVHFIGNHSMVIIAVSGLFVGFVLSLQLYNLLARYGSSELAGLAVNLSLVRELGPVITALLFAGRAGTSLTAEIGLMKSGEQLTALDMMAIDPIARIIAPRFWGGFFAMPFLAAVFSCAGLIGAWLIVVGLVGLDNGAFWGQMQSSVDWWLDVGQGVIKSLVFGAVVTAIALFEGYEANPTPEGVAKATTATVVTGSLAVLGLDFILTAFMFT